MKLLFQSSNGNERVIAEVDSFDEAIDVIDKFLDEHNFKSYYKRMWFHEGRMCIDCGSWYEFFFLEPWTRAEELELMRIVGDIKDVENNEE